MSWKFIIVAIVATAAGVAGTIAYKELTVPRTTITSPGMQAVTIDISPETAAGGFILPNDRVDVLHFRSSDARTSETILTNIRVLAIDHRIGTKNGLQFVEGKIGTLELTASQAETLKRVQGRGIFALSLRSIQ